LALVVAGHNTVLADAIPGFSDALYGFHVHAFLFLPFLFPSARFSGPWLRERAVRYLVPYTAFYAVACLLFAALYRRGDPASAVAIDVAIGWVTASTRALKDACGLKMFWFLPALLSLVLFRGVWTSSSRAARCLLMAVAIAAHGVVGALPVEVKRYTPMGLLAVVYVFPMALAAEWLWGHLRRRPRGAVAVVAFTGFAACLTLHVGLGTSSRIGSVNVYT